MAPTLLLLVAALAASSTASPIVEKRQKCNVQSCAQADIAGTTGNAPKWKTSGGNAAGNACIKQYTGLDVNTLPNDKPGTTYQSGGAVSRRDEYASMMIEAAKRYPIADVEEEALVEKRQGCKPNILIFGKGTFETGALGITVGPAVKRNLPAGSWDVRGVQYDATLEGDECLGLPGGKVATKMINQAAASCPGSKIFAGGYSQGAMVAHVGVANANAEAKSKVAGVLTFGDPFDGAPIKGYKGPIKTFCASGDGVCQGALKISVAHLSYTVSSAGQGAAWLKQTAGS